jgi:hypothetical protein
VREVMTLDVIANTIELKIVGEFTVTAACMATRYVYVYVVVGPDISLSLRILCFSSSDVDSILLLLLLLLLLLGHCKIRLIRAMCTQLCT